MGVDYFLILYIDKEIPQEIWYNVSELFRRKEIFN